MALTHDDEERGHAEHERADCPNNPSPRPIFMLVRCVLACRRPLLSYENGDGAALGAVRQTVLAVDGVSSLAARLEPVVDT
jgi:hypothetical protein